MTYPKFEEIWQSKFQNAQKIPSEAVWEAIAWQIGAKERQRKKWIAWWAAALVAFFLGDGRFVYNFYGEIFTGIWKQETTIAGNLQTNQKESKEEQTFVKKNKKIKKEIGAFVPSSERQEGANFFFVEAAYDLAEQQVAAKRPHDEIIEEVLGKPKKKSWWLKTYANAQNIQTAFAYTPQLPIATRMVPNLQTIQKEHNLQKEIASFRHIFTWGLGTEIGWQFHKNFYVSSGLHWQRSLFAFESNSRTPELLSFWGRRPVKEPIFSSMPISTVETVVVEENTISMADEEAAALPVYHFKQRMDFHVMPIKLGYQRVGHRWQYGVALGLENNFLLSNTFRSAEENFGEVSQNANRLQMAALAEISVGFRLNHKTSLHISPSFRQFLGSSVVPNPSLQVSNKNFGVGFGLQIGL